MGLMKVTIGCWLKTSTRRTELRTDAWVVGVGPHMTDAVAEYHSALKALEWVSDRYPGSEVTVCSDSHKLLNHLSGKWKVRVPSLKVLWGGVKQAEAKISSVTYERLERSDPRLAGLRTSMQLAQLQFLAQARKEIEGEAGKRVSFKNVDEPKVRDLVNEFFMFAEQRSGPEEAYLAVKIFQSFFEHGLRYQYDSLEDAEKAWKLASQLLLRRVQVPVKAKVQEPEMYV